MVSGENKAKVKRGRNPYKPQELNVDTRIMLLRVAKTLFEEKGFAGTSVNEIAKVADVNKALVYYYFGNKDNILKEVLNVAAKDATERREDFLHRDVPFSKKTLKEYYNNTLKIMESKKEVIKILLGEEINSQNTSDILFVFWKMP